MLGDLLSAGTKLLGGIIGQSESEKNREFQLQQQQQNIALQKEFAQSGLQWKVEDAKKAGIHPLYAMGAPSISPAVSVLNAPVGGMGAAVSSMGQDISRAMQATQNSQTRDDAFSESVRQLQLQNYTLRNDLLASQIAKLKQGSMPSMPTPGNIPEGQMTSVPLDDKPKHPRLVFNGEEVRHNRGWSPASDVEDTYGETVSDWVYGPLKLYMDWVNHSKPVWEANRKINQSQKEQRYQARPAGRNY